MPDCGMPSSVIRRWPGNNGVSDRRSEQQLFHVEPLSPKHDRAGFVCGNDRIDKYFRETVTQDAKRRLANCFVVVETATGKLAGFYTLTSSSMLLNQIPEDLRKKLPGRVPIGVALIGWLGRHVDFTGKGVGEKLLVDAIRTVAGASVASHAIIVDAIDEKAIEFYHGYGFVSLGVETSGRMYLPVATALKALEG
jgi:ribosomal protein S18 acetylase RimI-like enzyme